MNYRKFILPIFILIALVQLYVPANMILNREDVLSKGKEFKFRVAPVDPTDPFRGKYINLRYTENSIVDDSGSEWKFNQFGYVVISEDTDGYAVIQSILKEAPTNNQDFFKAKTRGISDGDSFRLTIDFPFDRFYMEESKAKIAEQIYRESLDDTSKVTYALVNIKQGEAILKDIIIDNIPIRELIKNKELK